MMLSGTGPADGWRPYNTSHGCDTIQRLWEKPSAGVSETIKPQAVGGLILPDDLSPKGLPPLWTFLIAPGDKDSCHLRWKLTLRWAKYVALRVFTWILQAPSRIFYKLILNPTNINTALDTTLPIS